MAGTPISDLAETFDTGFGVFTVANPNHPAPTVADGALQFPMSPIPFTDSVGQHHDGSQYISTAGTYDLTGGELTVHIAVPEGQGMMWSSQVGVMLTDTPLSTRDIYHAVYLTWSKDSMLGEAYFYTSTFMYNSESNTTKVYLVESEWPDGAWLRVRENNGTLTFDMTDPSCSQQIALGTAPVPPELDIASLYVSLIVGSAGGDSLDSAGTILAVNTNRTWCPPGIGYIWNGTTWVAPSIWNGTRWVPGHEARAWNGTTWIPLGTAPVPVLDLSFGADGELPDDMYTEYGDAEWTGSSIRITSELDDYSSAAVSQSTTWEFDREAVVRFRSRLKVEGGGNAFTMLADYDNQRYNPDVPHFDSGTYFESVPDGVWLEIGTEPFTVKPGKARFYVTLSQQNMGPGSVASLEIEWMQLVDDATGDPVMGTPTQR